MKVFHSSSSVLHAPTIYFRRGKAIPHLEQPTRYDVLLNAATSAGHDVQIAARYGLDPIKAVHSERYLAFLEQAWRRRDEIEPGLDYVLPSHFSRPDMAHYPAGLIGQVGFHMADLSTPIHQHTYESVLGSVDATMNAADVALKFGHAYALCRPPGHHASSESAGGFCFINNTAIAAAYLQKTLGCKVGTVDIDVHHGNGTQSIFYGRDDVVTASIHADPSSFMPYYAGYSDEHGAGSGKGFNLNFPLPHGSGDDVYLQAIDSALEFCASRGVEALVVALGLDASIDDPNGKLAITTEGFHRAGKKLATPGWPTVLVQEGGYLSDQLGANLQAFLNGFDSQRVG